MSYLKVRTETVQMRSNPNEKQGQIHPISLHVLLFYLKSVLISSVP